MLKTRVIPTLLIRGQEAVKGERFQGWRRIGSAINAVRVHSMRNVDELIILNIDGTFDLDLMENICAECTMPVTVGGGVRTLDHIRDLLRVGADKVSVNTMAHEPNFIKNAARKFGNQAIVVSIDLGTTDYPDDLARSMHHKGAGEILLGNVNQDGTMKGYNIPMIAMISGSVNIPVIASGGCSGSEDMKAALDAGAHAVAAGALFQFTNATPRSMAEELHKMGVNVRL